jgi:hypothetical protein
LIPDLQAALVEVQHVEDNPLGGALEGVVVPADLERADGDTLSDATLLFSKTSCTLF